MFPLHTEIALLDTGRSILGFAVNWFLQSTVLILAGLMLGQLLRHRGSAALSAVYRTTLVGVLVCPLATCLLAFAGVSGWSLEMPTAWTDAPARKTQPLQAEPPEKISARASAGDREQPLTGVGETSSIRGFPLQSSSDSNPVLSVPAEFPPAASPSSLAAGTNAELDADRSLVPGAVSTPADAALVNHFGLWAIGISCLWLAVFTVLMMRLAIAWWRLARLRRIAQPAEPSTIATCREVAALLAVPAPDVLCSPFFSSPCLTGLRRPAVLLPDGSQSLLIRDVLVHELAHLQRRDCHWNLLWRLALSVFFFQPLLWLLARRLEATAEEVCDDYVVQFGGNRAEYARRLVDIAELSCTPVAAAAVGIVSLRSMLAKRVVRIMDTSRGLSTHAGNWMLTLVLVGGLISTVSVGFVGVGKNQSANAIEPTPRAVATASGDETKTDDAKPVTTLPKDAAKKVDDAAAPQANTNDKPKGDSKPAPTSDVRGRVVGADGKPVAGAKIYWFRSRVHDIHPMKPKLVGKTDEAGNFKFVLPTKSAFNPAELASWRYTEQLVIMASGHGFATESPRTFHPEPPAENFLSSLVQGFEVKKVTLPAAGAPLRGRLVNIDGQPIVGASVRIRWFEDNRLRGLSRRNAAAPDKNNAELQSRVQHLLNVIEPVPLREVLPMATTDETGRFELRDVGEHHLLQLLVQGERIESTDIVVRNEPGETIVLAPDRHSEGAAKTVYAQDFLRAIGPSRPINGRVADLDTGAPIAGAIVRAYVVAGSRLHSSRERDEFAVRTDADGRYQVSGLPIGAENRLVAFTDGDVAYIPVGLPIDTSKGETIEQNFGLKQGVWAEGRVFDVTSKKPFLGEITYYWFRNRELEQTIPGLLRAFVDGCYWTNDNGEFRVPVLRSRGILAFRCDRFGDDPEDIVRFPRGSGAELIKGDEGIGATRVFPTLPHFLSPMDFHRVAEVSPNDEQTTIRVDMPLVASSPLQLRVVDADGKPVVGFAVYGAAERWGWQPKESAQFEISDLRPGERRKVFVHHRARNLSGGVIVKQGEAPLGETLVTQIKLAEAGSVTGRLVDRDGEPITDASLFVDYEKLGTEDDTAIWANGVGLVANPTTIPVDEKGRFLLDGLIPGWIYNVHASAPRKYQGQLMDRVIGDPIQGLRVKPGEKKDLGDLVVADKESKLPDAAATIKPEAAAKPKAVQVTGRVTSSEGKPVAGAHIAAIGMNAQPLRGGDLTRNGEILAQAVSDQDGQYKLVLEGVSSKTHHYASLIARKEGAAIAWQTLNLDAVEIEAPLKLPIEEPIQGRFVDIEGQPAADMQLRIQSVMQNVKNARPPAGVGYEGKDTPAAWLPRVTCDKQGRFTIHGVPAGHGVFIKVAGNDRFAPQDVALNTGMEEQRGERDATYRSLVKNVGPGEEAVLPLAPAQIFEGVITFQDTGKPVPNARLNIWASQQAEGGSMISIAGQADDQGRYHLIPWPGIRFGLTAYPPESVPYLVRTTSKAIKWGTGDRVKKVDLTLPRGVLVRGKVVESGTGKPIENASIQYIPESANNSLVSDSIITGWQGMEVSNKDGQFQIVVLSGPGRLIAHASGGSYVLQEIGSSLLDLGKAGGQRSYAHAIHKLDLQPKTESVDVTIEIQPGEVITGRIVNEQGKSVDEALVISRLSISPSALWWRGHTPPVLGGKFELTGLQRDADYPTYFLDAKHRLGATMNLKAGGAEPTVVLQTCGVAHLRFVDRERQPVAGFYPTVEMVVTPGVYRFDSGLMRAGQLAADSDFIGNIDQTNYGALLKTDQDGKVTLPALIPGATYRLVIYQDGKNQVVKEFQVKANEVLDLGDFTVERSK